MKNLKTLFLTGMLITAFGAYALAQNAQPQNQPNGYILDYCPWHNTHSNMMAGQGMMRPEMMSRGMVMHDGCCRMNGNMTGQHNNSYACPWDVAEFNAWKKMNQISMPLSKDTAKRWAEYYVAAYNNPDLTLGKIEEKDNGFELEVRSKKDKKVQEKILVDKTSGWISRVQ